MSAEIKTIASFVKTVRSNIKKRQHFRIPNSIVMNEQNDVISFALPSSPLKLSQTINQKSHSYIPNKAQPAIAPINISRNGANCVGTAIVSNADHECFANSSDSWSSFDQYDFNTKIKSSTQEKEKLQIFRVNSLLSDHSDSLMNSIDEDELFDLLNKSPQHKLQAKNPPAITIESPTLPHITSPKNSTVSENPEIRERGQMIKAEMTTPPKMEKQQMANRRTIPDEPILCKPPATLNRFPSIVTEGNESYQTSSPDWHKTETLYPKRKILSTPEKPKKACTEATILTKIQKNEVTTNSNVLLPAMAKENLLESSKPRVTYSPLVSKRAFTTNSITNATLDFATQKGKNTYDESTNGKANSGAKRVQAIILTKEQRRIIELAKKGVSLFYTGSAGTGKSLLLRTLIKEMRALHGHSVISVTASTGLAACNIGGTTLHSFAGIGLGNGDIELLIKKVKKNKKSRNRWISCKVLIIDEISMIDGALLDKLNTIAQKVRCSNAPFGGIQLIVCGDFYQLPPVSKQEKVPALFAFESQSWKETIEYTIVLQEVFRQKGDTKFIDMLNEMRGGTVSKDTLSELKKLSRNLPTDDGIEPAELFSTRSEVDRANGTRLLGLPGQTRVFRSTDGGNLPEPQREAMLLNFLAPRDLLLKKNSQVMCIKNYDETLVNGTLGRVLGFVDKDTYMSYAKEGDANSGREKSDVNSDETNNNESSSDSIFEFLKQIETNDEMTRQDIQRKQERMEELESNSKNRCLPLVRFRVGNNIRDVLVEPEEWKIEDENEKPLAKRIQVPLMLAWALSIHKSQGQTLNKVKVDLKKVFEKGQAYVALSRAVSREGLQVLNFDSVKVQAHPKVIEFYSTLMSAEQAVNGSGGDSVIKNKTRSTDIRRALTNPLEEGQRLVDRF